MIKLALVHIVASLDLLSTFLLVSLSYHGRLLHHVQVVRDTDGEVDEQESLNDFGMKKCSHIFFIHLLTRKNPGSPLSATSLAVL